MTTTTNEIANAPTTDECSRRPDWNIQLQNDLFDALSLMVDGGWTQGTFKHRVYNYETNDYDLGVKFCALGAIWEVVSGGRDHANNEKNLTPWQSDRWHETTLALHNALPMEKQVVADECAKGVCECSDCNELAKTQQVAWRESRMNGRRRNAITNWNDRTPSVDGSGFADIREVFIKALFLNAPD